MELPVKILELAGGALIVIGFIIFVKIFGLINKSRKVIDIAKSSIAIVQDENLDDLAKEIAMQRYATKLFSLFFLITLGSIAAVAIPFSLVWLMELAQLLTVNKVIETTLTLEFITGSTIISIVFFWLMRKYSE